MDFGSGNGCGCSARGCRGILTDPWEQGQHGAVQEELGTRDTGSTAPVQPWLLHSPLLQGKTVIQAEIDAAAELIDFFRFNAKYALELEQSQPLSVDISTNSMVYRGLEVS